MDILIEDNCVSVVTNNFVINYGIHDLDFHNFLNYFFDYFNTNSYKRCYKRIYNDKNN